MKNTNLIQLLNYFKLSDIRSFSKFIASPYFNSNTAAISLFSEIRKHYPEFNSAHFTKQNIYIKVFPGEKYNDVKFRKLVSDLNLLAEKYISVERLTKDENQMYNAFLNFKKAKSFFYKNELHLRNWGSILTNPAYKIDEDYYYYRFCFNSLLTHFDSFKGNHSPQSKTIELVSLTKYFALKAMQIFCVNQIYKVIYNIENDNLLLEELLSLEKGGFFKDEPLISIYCKIVRLFNLEMDESRKLLHIVHSEIAGIETRISNQEKSFLFWVVSQYIILTSKKFILTEFKSLKWHYLKKQIEIEIEEGGKFSWPVYLSIINNGLAQNETEWTEKFIVECTHLVSSGDNTALLSWAKAKLLNARGKYNESLKELLLINTNQGNLKIDIDSLTVINYYELKRYNELSYYLQTFKKYLDKSNIVRNRDTNKNTCGGFIKAVNQLVKLNYSTNPKEKTKIISKIEKITENRILFRSWILEKLKASKIKK
ncbi:MAG: hypothetical protein IAE90_01150 [Ignavibacteria bacterium]|nr:hypothetical protein [Ignavibacteria bacterium]